MKTLLAIIPLLLASCSPRLANVRPPDRMDTAPVARAVEETVAAGKAVDTATKQVRSATNEVKVANAKASELTIRLKEQMDRTRLIAQGNQELQDSLAASDAIIEEMSQSNMSMTIRLGALGNNVTVLEFANEGLIKSNAILEERLDHIQQAKARQDIQIEEARVALASAAAIQPKLIIAQDKLDFWRWKFAPFSIIAIVGLILFIIYKPRLPFFP